MIKKPTAYNSGYTVRYRSPKPLRASYTHKSLNKIFRLPWLNGQRKSENHLILPPSFNQNEKEKKKRCARLLRSPAYNG